MNKKKSRFNLTFIFSFLVFIIILFTIAVLGCVLIFLLKTNIIDINKVFPSNHTGEKADISRLILAIVVLSLVIGTFFSFFLGKTSLRPIRQLINGMNDLAKGDFDVRLTIHNQHLPFELKQVSESFNQMANELGSIEMLRNDFINNFSHEFKTPIVSIRGFAKLLKKGDLTPKEQEEYLDIIISESEHLSTLSTNILHLSHIENQTISINNREYNLTEQIRKSILILESAWSQKKLDLIIDLDEVTMYADEELLSHIWINLIDNAIKYSNTNGKIQIDLMKFSDTIVFKVSDYGKGMDSKEKNRIFDKFYQGDQSHASKGNGIGLTIVKKIIDIYKGNIHVTSQKGFGTIITVTLPLYEIDND